MMYDMPKNRSADRSIDRIYKDKIAEEFIYAAMYVDQEEDKHRRSEERLTAAVCAARVCHACMRVSAVWLREQGSGNCPDRIPERAHLTGAFIYDGQG